MGKVCRRITWLTSINHRNCSSRASEGDRRGVTVAKMRITEDRESDRLQNCSSFLIMVASKPTVPRIATSEEASCGLLGQRCQHGHEHGAMYMPPSTGDQQLHNPPEA